MGWHRWWRQPRPCTGRCLVIETITTRALDPSDVEPVLELLRAALGEPPLLKRTPELFAWKHFDNPFGESIALVAEAGGSLVGLRAFMRWELRTPDGDTLRCVRAVDTATHPDFQRRGIFRRLTEEALEQASADGVDLVFNTPNDKSGGGYLSMGWAPVGKVGVMIRPKLGRSSAPANPDRFEELLAEATPYKPPVDVDRRPLGLRTPRTDGYLHWRYASHPTARYFWYEGDDSVAVVRPNVRDGRGEVLIADLLGPRPAGAVGAAVRAARSSYVAAWFSKGSPERAAAIRRGLLPIPGVAPLTLMARPLRDLPVDVFSMSSWDLALGDLELL